MDGKGDTKRILLVDAHPVTSLGLAALVAAEPAMEVCGTAGTAAEALEGVGKGRPDLVITDLTLPDRPGLEFLKDLRTQHRGVPVLVISLHDEAVYAERVLRAGAKGYVSKDAAREDILGAIRRVVSGGVYLSEAVVDEVLRGMAGGGTDSRSLPVRRLSDRELEVFELMGHGRCSNEVADELHISVRTVDAHRRNIRKKLQFHDHFDALSHAIRWVESGKFE